jgi:hypothetical protein
VTSAFGGQHSIQLSYGRVRPDLTDQAKAGNARQIGDFQTPQPPAVASSRRRPVIALAGSASESMTVKWLTPATDT